MMLIAALAYTYAKIGSHALGLDSDTAAFTTARTSGA